MKRLTFTRKEACEKLGISDGTFRKYLKRTGGEPCGTRPSSRPSGSGNPSLLYDQHTVAAVARAYREKHPESFIEKETKGMAKEQKQIYMKRVQDVDQRGDVADEMRGVIWPIVAGVPAVAAIFGPWVINEWAAMLHLLGVL